MKIDNIDYITTSFAQTIFCALFTYLKLTGQIDWSWVWVFSPFWLPIATVLGLLVVIFVVSMTVMIVGELTQRI